MKSPWIRPPNCPAPPCCSSRASEGLKDVATRVPALRRIARRFIAGETLEEAVAAVKELNARGMSVSL